MPNSTVSLRRRKPTKPQPDFPLFPHASGHWCRKIKGRFHYFGKWRDDPRGEAALELWLEQKDYLLAGRTPPSTPDGLTVGDLCNCFLTAKERQRDAGDIRPKTFAEYYATCRLVVDAFGKTRLAADVRAEDFEALRASLSKRLGVHGLSREVQQVRSLFKYGFDAGLMERPARFGPTFKRPSKRIMRAHRQKSGPRMFGAPEIRKLLENAEQPLKAMIMLGINCGFGNTDCGTLPKRAVDLVNGWIDYPRPKTAVERRCPLWPETIAAVKEAVARRPKAQLEEHDELVFITSRGQPWAKDTPDNPVSKEFRKLLDRIDAAAVKQANTRKSQQPPRLHRPGLGFYALRHTFETIAGESRDQVAIDFIMGHADASMAGLYREWISDERLRGVVDVVRQWLFPKGKQC